MATVEQLDLLQELSLAACELAEHDQRIREHTALTHVMIRNARKEGATVSEISKVSGYSRQRIYEILRIA